MPSENVHQKNVPDRPLLIIMFDSRVDSGTTAPLMQRICMRYTLGSHFSVIASTMNSLATSPKPSMSGKETNAVKRIILRKAFI